jgi:DNA-binding beta-propeller fold protein YncE
VNQSFKRSYSILFVRSLALLLFLVSLSFAQSSLAPPKWIDVNENRGGVNLRWFRVQGAVKYQVHRRVGEGTVFQPIGGTVNPHFDDLSVSPGQVYFYTITAVGRDGVSSEKAIIQYIRLPPVEPEFVKSPDWALHQIRRDGIALAWRHENPDHVFAFNVYRRKDGDSSFNLVNSTLDTTFMDRDVLEGNKYDYVVTALDKQLQESNNSRVLEVMYVSPITITPTDARLAAIKTLEEVTTRTEVVTEFSEEVYGFVSPVDIEYTTREQKLYVSDSGTGLITVIGPTGEVLNSLGGRGSQPWEFDRLLGIAVDEHDNVYAVDAYRGEIVVFSSHGNFNRRIKLKQKVLDYFGPGFHLQFPWFRFGLIDIVATNYGGLIVVDNPNGWIYLLDKKDELVKVIGERGSDPGNMYYPTFINLDSSGKFIVSDTLNSRLQMFDSNGEYIRVIGERGSGIGQFLRPKGVTTSQDGYVYVADSQQNVIQVFDSEGEFQFLLGNERGLPIDLGSPNGLVFVEPNQLIICEKLARRVQIRKILPGTMGNQGPIDVAPLKRP